MDVKGRVTLRKRGREAQEDFWEVAERCVMEPSPLSLCKTSSKNHVVFLMLGDYICVSGIGLEENGPRLVAR